MSKELTGAEMVIEARVDQGFEHLFGYPGGAVLPIYDALFQQDRVRHILVRHEQGAVHAAEGYARSTGKVGCVLVTSGPGATNAVTGLTDALMDSIPVVCITGQVPTHLIGNDAFQECDTVGITRPCTKHNYLVKNIADLSSVLHEAFYVAKSGRPGPGVVDIPKDIKNAKADVGIIGDCAHVLEDMVRLWRSAAVVSDKAALGAWWKHIDKWRARKSLAYRGSNEIIKPQYAIQRLYELTKDRDVYITTEVGQHQMWAAQFYHFQEPNRWMTSGGLGTMGYGLPASVGVQLAHPNSLVIDIAGEASVLMTIQEMSTAVQYDLPIKIFIINNQYMGMVRQWQELLHGGRYSHSYSEALPDFVKLADAYHGIGIRCDKPGDLDHAIKEMINVDKPVIFDCLVDQAENCFPMIPSGKAHNEMLLADVGGDIAKAIDEKGKVLV